MHDRAVMQQQVFNCLVNSLVHVFSTQLSLVSLAAIATDRRHVGDGTRSRVRQPYHSHPNPNPAPLRVYRAVRCKRPCSRKTT